MDDFNNLDPEAMMNNLSDVEEEPDSEKEESEEEEEESDSEEEIKNKNNNNDDVKNSDPYLELPEDEFIIDDVDFEFQEEKDNLEIFEQEIIPEHKVISNDEDQAEDLINEILRMMPEKQRKNKKEIKKGREFT